MIRLYTGTPGSGKSLHAAYEIIDMLLSGHRVIANFPIDTGYFEHLMPRRFYHWSNGNMTPERLKLFALLYHVPFREGQTLLVIDECGMLFNPRSWKDADRNAWLDFFAQHRKLGYDVLLIAQMDKQLDKQILGQIEEDHRHRAIKNYKFFGKLISALAGGLFLDVTYWYPCRLKIGSSFFRYRSKEAGIYDTFKIFDV